MGGSGGGHGGKARSCCCLCVVCGGCSRFLGLSPGPPSAGPPKILLFFLSLHSFFSLLWSSRGILVVFEAPGRSNVHVWVSPPLPTRPGRQGFTEQPENSKRAHLSVSVLQNTTKIPRETTRERRKNEISGGRARRGGARTQKRWGRKGWEPEISRFFFFSLPPAVREIGGPGRGGAEEGPAKGWSSTLSFLEVVALLDHFFRYVLRLLTSNGNVRR